jgi:rare lipoprotein A (peptidoglycan hydrolase)
MLRRPLSMLRDATRRAAPPGQLRSRGLRAVAAGTLALLASCAPSHPAKAAPNHDRRHPSHGGHHPSRPASPGAAGPPRTSPEASAPPAAAPPGERALEATYGGRRPVQVLSGEASYYGNSLAGHKTASGERYDPSAFTAAHRTLPLGTIVRVVRVDTRATVYVRITDRGPFGSAHRILDLSWAAAERLGMIRRGVAEVRVEVLELAPRRR